MFPGHFSKCTNYALPPIFKERRWNAWKEGCPFHKNDGENIGVPLTEPTNDIRIFESYKLIL